MTDYQDELREALLDAGISTEETDDDEFRALHEDIWSAPRYDEEYELAARMLKWITAEIATSGMTRVTMDELIGQFGDYAQTEDGEIAVRTAACLIQDAADVIRAGS